MKTKYLCSLSLGILITLSLLGASGASAQAAQSGYTGPTFDSIDFPNFQPNVPYVCADQYDQSNVTATLNLAEGTPNDQIVFNTSTLVAPKDACVALVIRNLSPDVVHDLVIEEVAGAAGITHVDMDVYNSTSNIGWGPGLNVFFFHTPNADAQFTYFCEQPGHEAQGEKGTLYVGAGPSSLSLPFGLGQSSQSSSTSTTTSTYNTINGQTPSFEFIEVLVGFMVIIILNHKRRN